MSEPNQPESKTIEELKKVSLRKIERGDTYASVFNYLKRNTEDNGLIEEIITQLKMKEDQGLIQYDEQETSEGFGINQIMGYILIFGGTALTVFLWNRGWVAFLTPILIIVGFYGIRNKPFDHWI
jgi:hypothetical protein